ncbi:MAG TPA: Uma2 family endonuclease [Gemmataceae bacterium]|jgi:Uma2 family endonuclease|nr:Uma2 family endonuclease [Gemmataceae bacterium]
MTAAVESAAPFTSPGELKNLLLDLLPGQGCWTDEDYLWLTDHTNRLVEFTDGHIEGLPMPTDRHQSILEYLFWAFTSYLKPLGGKVHLAGIRLRIREGKYREPDLILLRSSKDPRREDRYWTGADLTLEVVSEDKPERDLVDKRLDYAEGGVPEYWIVNPLVETITVLRLEGNAYVEHGVFPRGTTATSALLADFGVNVDGALDAD